MGPWLDWARTALGADLLVATGIMPVTQPQDSLAALGRAVVAHDDWELGMLYRATTLGGSLVLGLAMVRGEMSAEAMFETAFLDELWQTEKWGSDWEARIGAPIFAPNWPRPNCFSTVFVTGDRDHAAGASGKTAVRS